MTMGFDCATKLTEKMAKDLYGAGFRYAARYLGDSWKSFNKKEAEVIQKAGIKLISIFQKSANKISYFTEKARNSRWEGRRKVGKSSWAARRNCYLLCS
ncbi:glycoside hydrolase domain-containing protein [Niallia circulans]|uniref:glycoside hydrolase domain-containing protein n=1 Tax=Niallia circulans TaxID=1397 RepID=UPI0030097FE9